MLGLCFGVLTLKAIPSECYFVIEPCGSEVARVVCIRTAWWIFEFRSNTISNHLLRQIASMWIVVLSTSDAQSPSHSSCHIDTKRVQSKMAVLLLLWCFCIIGGVILLRCLRCPVGIAIPYMKLATYVLPTQNQWSCTQKLCLQASSAGIHFCSNGRKNTVVKLGDCVLPTQN